MTNTTNTNTTNTNKAITTLHAQTTASKAQTTANTAREKSKYQIPTMAIENSQSTINYYSDIIEGERLQDGAQLIVNTALKTLRVNGNETALAINYYSDIYQDLTQEAAAALMDCGSWLQDGSRIIFDDENQKSNVYSSVSRYIYRHKTRIIKSLYIYNHNGINSKGETIDEDEQLEIIRYTDAVRAYVASMESIETRQAIEELRHTLTEKQNNILDYMLDGYTQEQIAIRLNISRSAVQSSIDCIRKKAHFIR